MAGQKIVFLDRDGTINVDHGYVNEAKQWEWIDGVFAGLKNLQQAGFKLAVVTNQSGIGHGLYSEQATIDLHRMMDAELRQRGIVLDAIAYCPHRRDKEECDCRKPNPGLAKQVARDTGPIDYRASWMIGDKETDVGFGKNIGAQTALIRSQYWNEGVKRSVQPDLIVESLYDFSQRGIVTKAS